MGLDNVRASEPCEPCEFHIKPKHPFQIALIQRILYGRAGIPILSSSHLEVLIDALPEPPSVLTATEEGVGKQEASAKDQNPSLHLVRPFYLTLRSETWSAYAAQITRLNIFHLRNLRRNLGINWMDRVYIALSVTACTQSLRSADFVGLDMYVVCLRIVYRRRSCSVKSFRRGRCGSSALALSISMY